MKKVLVLVFVALVASTTVFGQNTIANRIAKSNSEIQTIESWYGWKDIKPFPHPGALSVGDVVENPGMIFEPTRESAYIKVWIKEVDPKTGQVIVTPIQAEVWGFPNWKELSNPMELIPITVKLTIWAGGTKKYWAWFDQPDYTLKASLN